MRESLNDEDLQQLAGLEFLDYTAPEAGDDIVLSGAL